MWSICKHEPRYIGKQVEWIQSFNQSNQGTRWWFYILCKPTMAVAEKKNWGAYLGTHVFPAIEKFYIIYNL